MKNKEQYKRILYFIGALIIICVFARGFTTVWCSYYNSDMRDPFWHNGNILMIFIYAVIYIIMARMFSGFRLGYSKWLGLLGSQILAITGSNVIEFILVSLIGRCRLNVLPMLVLTLCEYVFAVVWSFLFTKLYVKIYPPRKMLIIYGNKNAKYLVYKMSQRQDKYSICASISCDERLDDIKCEILKYEAVIITDIPNDLRNKILKFTFENSIRVYINPKLSDIIVRGADDFNLFDTPLLLSRNDGLKLEQKAIKRFFDILLSGIALVIASPIMLAAAIVIKSYDHGPVLYSQKRLTTNGRIFKVYKFRSMIVNAEKKSGAMLASKNDKRITPVGKVLRKTRLDELPQLINIFKGDMSFVGPRPERPEIAQKYEKTMPEFKYRLKVKAGLTGYAQVMGKYNTTPYDKLKFDLMYIEHCTILQDFKIMLMTLKICFMPDAAEGVKNTVPLETHRDRIEHDSSKDKAASAVSEEKQTVAATKQ